MTMTMVVMMVLVLENFDFGKTLSWICLVGLMGNDYGWDGDQ